MSGTDSTERFISEITQQLIFQTFLDSLSVDNESKLLSQNKLVCRNNLDLFFANENLVRCCTINSEYTNFRLLDNKYDDFKIRSLEMNSLGSLLAIIGDTDLVVVSLPMSLTASNSSLLPVRSYKIHGLEGQIKKVVWQSIISHDCCLVVLNDKSQIKSYDLSLSSYEPQLSIDLHKDEIFKNEEATSITFGSHANLSGSLTLYVSTSRSNIFAIYPFIHKLGKIATTKSNVSDLLDESKSIINAIQEKIPSQDVVQSCDQSVLNRASANQYAYILSLYKQFETSFSAKKEYRQLLAEKPVEYSTLTQELPHDFRPVLQGPVSTLREKTLKDLICISSNDKISILASISVSSLNEPFLSYHSQLKPFIMNWKETEKDSVVKANVSPKVESEERKHDSPQKCGYVRPRKGFGFIDQTELSSDMKERITNISSEEVQIKNREMELLFWKNEFTELSTLAVDQIPINASKFMSLSILDSVESKISLKIGNNIIYFDCGKWCENFVRGVSNGHKPQLNVSSDYKLVVESSQELSSYALVKDTISETGEFLIILKKNKDNNLEVKQISENNMETNKNVIVDDIIVIEKAIHESVLTKEPFDELLSELESLKRVNPSTLQRALSMKKEMTKISTCDPNTEILKNLNQLSTETLQQVSRFTTFAIRLNLRVITQIDELKFQIHSLQRINNTGLGKETLDSKNEKANSLITRQDKINERIQNLQEKIFNSIQKINYAKSLPLSDAEKSWYKEINSMNAQISQDTNDAKCLSSMMENMSAQVSKIINYLGADQNTTNESTTNPQSIEENLTELQAHRKILKLKQWLHQENELIVHAKDKLEEAFKQLKI